MICAFFLGGNQSSCSDLNDHFTPLKVHINRHSWDVFLIGFKALCSHLSWLITNQLCQLMLAGKPFLSCLGPNWALRREIAVSATNISNTVVIVMRRSWLGVLGFCCGMDGVVLLMGWMHSATMQRVLVVGVPWVLCPRELKL